MIFNLDKMKNRGNYMYSINENDMNICIVN